MKPISSRVVGVLAAMLILAGCSGPTAPTAAPQPTAAVAPTAAASNGEARSASPLSNGLEVVITPIPEAPTVAVAMVFGVGSDHDPDGRSGLAHFAEHLLVTAATESEPSRTVEELVAGYPHGWNAQTGADFTILATVVDPSDMAAELEVMAARLAGVQITTADVERERTRILLEVENMFGGIPALAAANLARERLLPTPNGGRRGGDPATLAALQLDDLTAWLENYHPGNATLSVAGPIDTDVVLDLIDKFFAPIPAGSSRPPAASALPANAGLIDATSTSESAAGIIALAFAAPGPNDHRYSEFLVAAARLFGEGPALGLSTAYALIDDPAVLTITAPLLAGEAVDEAAARVASIVEDIVVEPLRTGETTQVARFFGPLLGFDVSANTYGVAFAAARRRSLGIDPVSTERELAATDNESYQAAVSALIVDAPLTAAAAN